MKLVKALLFLCILSVSAPSQAALITTTFAGGNGQSGNAFDVDVSTNPLTVTGITIHNNIGGDWNVYSRSGTVVGATASSAGWTLHSTNTVGTTPGAVFIDVADFTLAANSTTGLLMIFSQAGGAVNYTDGSSFGSVTASNSDIAIREGYGVGSSPTNFGGQLFGTPGGGSRIWNGTLHYDVAASSPVPEPSTIALFTVLGLGVVLRRRSRRSFP